MGSKLFAGVTPKASTQLTGVKFHSLVFLSFKNVFADVFMCITCVVTIRACKWPSIDVNTHVALQVCLARGFVRAVITGKVPGLIMSFDVTSEPCFGGCPKPTHVTKVLLLPSVGEHVRFEFSTQNKCPVTPWPCTFVVSISVTPHVTDELLWRVEPGSTNL